MQTKIDKDTWKTKNKKKTSNKAAVNNKSLLSFLCIFTPLFCVIFLLFCILHNTMYNRVAYIFYLKSPPSYCQMYFKCRQIFFMCLFCCFFPLSLLFFFSTIAMAFSVFSSCMFSICAWHALVCLISNLRLNRFFYYLLIFYLFMTFAGFLRLQWSLLGLLSKIKFHL